MSKILTNAMSTAIVALAALLSCGECGGRVIWPAEGVRATGECGAALKFVNGSRTAIVRAAADLPWPGVVFRFNEQLDLSSTNQLQIALSNRTDRLLRIVCDAKAEGRDIASLRAETTLRPHASGVMNVRYVPKVRELPVKLEGMEGYFEPGKNALQYPSHLDRVTTLCVFVSRLGSPAEFAIERIELQPVAAREESALPPADKFFPFVDEFGQFMHSDWPGKVHSEAELRAQGEAEAKWLREHAERPIVDADRFGGWLKGPQLAATGRFRTEKVNGKWWLVDPDGHLFFSQGINSIGRVYIGTKVAGRERYFAKLPSKLDDRGFVMFPPSNVARKYGVDWKRGWTDFTLRRLRAWGFNTIGNWSIDSLCEREQIPYTVWVHLWCANAISVEGRNFPDVFSDEFRARLKSEMARVEKLARSPWCIGLFVDNEIGWGHNEHSFALAVAAAPENQPAKAEYRRWLKAKRGGVETELSSATMAEQEAFHAYMAETYFRLTRETVKAAYPDTLYISCRFAWGGLVANRMAAKYCDIVAWNLYRESPIMELPSGAEDKPIIVGEFHFGALDRGLLHASVSPTLDQRDRADKYLQYVRLALESTNLVGVHWFAWRDQMVTGRGDGEDFQDGFVDVTDRPYPEMVEAARTLAGELYPRK